MQCLNKSGILIFLNMELIDRRGLCKYLVSLLDHECASPMSLKQLVECFELVENISNEMEGLEMSEIYPPKCHCGFPKKTYLVRILTREQFPICSDCYHIYDIYHEKTWFNMLLRIILSKKRCL